MKKREKNAPVTEETPEVAAEETTEDVENAEIAFLTAELDRYEAKAAEYLNVAQRIQADFDNFRRRNESVRADAMAEGQRTVVKAMLPVLDNLERALAAPAAESDALRTGLEMTHRQMIAALEKLGVTAIDRVGEKFDPNLEEAIMQVPASSGEPGTVAMVLQKGYLMGSYLIRAAMVQVVAE